MDPQPLDDRPLSTPLVSRLPADPRERAAVLQAHAEALRAGESMYPDPRTGLFVLTASYLADRGYCCGRGCRHCPYPSSNEPDNTSQHGVSS